MSKLPRITGILAVPLIALVIACGGGDDDDDTPSASTGGGADPTPAQATGGNAGATGSTGSQSTGSGGGSATGSQPTGATGPAATGSSDDDDFDPEDCPELQALAESAGLEDSFAGGGLGDDFNAENFRRLADNAPGEIREDMQLLAGVLEEFFGKLEELELDFSNPASFASLTPEELAELEELTTRLDTPEIAAASERVEAYFAEVCS